jgi:hypothetical protein
VLPAGFQGLLDDECAAGVVAGFLVGFLDHLNLHDGVSFLVMWRTACLFTRFKRLLDDECAAGVIAGLLVRLLDDLDSHELFLSVSETG